MGDALSSVSDGFRFQMRRKQEPKRESSFRFGVADGNSARFSVCIIRGRDEPSIVMMMTPINLFYEKNNGLENGKTEKLTKCDRYKFRKFKTEGMFTVCFGDKRYYCVFSLNSLTLRGIFQLYYGLNISLQSWSRIPRIPLDLSMGST